VAYVAFLASRTCFDHISVVSILQRFYWFKNCGGTRRTSLSKLAPTDLMSLSSELMIDLPNSTTALTWIITYLSVQRNLYRIYWKEYNRVTGVSVVGKDNVTGRGKRKLSWMSVKLSA